jgi:murein L,D-transpeptidase YafK
MHARRFHRRRLALLVALVPFAAACESVPARNPEPAAPVEATPDPVVEEPATEHPCSTIVRIEVWKEERTLRAYCKRGAVIVMDAAMGREEIGPKLRSGDHRTPEGQYHIAGDASPGRFHLFIPIDYPSADDAEEARAGGWLSASDYARILDAHEAGLSPPADTSLGGDLGFHGEGDRWQGDSEYFDWTYGCVAVTDEEIEFLSERVEIGVPVWIHP